MEVSEPVADAQNFLDQQVDGFGGSVADTAGDEVGQEFGAPDGDRAGQSAQFGGVQRHGATPAVSG